MAAHSQARLDLALEDLDVFLEFAREESSHLVVNALHVGDERQQSEQDDHRGKDRPDHRRPTFRAGRVLESEASSLREINVTGNPNFVRRRSSLRRISPESVSWS